MYTNQVLKWLSILCLLPCLAWASDRAVLHNTFVDIDADHDPVLEILPSILRDAGIDYIISGRIAETQITLHAKHIRLELLLDVIRYQTGHSYSLKDETLVFFETSIESPRFDCEKNPETEEFIEYENEIGNFAFKAEWLSPEEAINQLTQRFGIKVVYLDAEPLSGSEMTFSLKNASLGQVLTVICDNYGYCWIFIDDFIFIRSRYHL